MEIEVAMPQPKAPWATVATGGLVLRVTQLACALATLAVTASTTGFSSHPALCFLAASSALQCVWTVSQALLNLCTLLSGQWPFQNHHWVVGSATIAGDGVTAAMSFFAASASSGMAVMVDGDLKLCATTTLNCARLRAAAWMGFAGCIALLPTLLLNWLRYNAGDGR